MDKHWRHGCPSHFDNLNPRPNPLTWHNALPAWILADPTYHALRQGPKATLQAIADQADAPNDAGHLLNCYGGERLVQRAGVCRRTFWNHLAKLEAAGFVVLLARIKRASGSTFNVYGIPGRLNGLIDVRKRRHFQQQVHRGGGVYEPVRTDPGQQPPLFQQTTVKSLHGAPCKNDTVHRAKIARNHPPHHPQDHPRGEGSRPTAGRKGTRRAVIKRIEQADLEQPGRFIAWFAEAVGYRPDGLDGTLIRHYAAAQYALRTARKPPAAFASIVRRRLWELPAQKDEDRAMALLKQHLYGQPAKRTKPYNPFGLE
jgi:hypothetical protein